MTAGSRRCCCATAGNSASKTAQSQSSSNRYAAKGYERGWPRPRPARGQPALFDAVWVAYRCRGNDCVKGTAFHVGDGLFYTNAHVARVETGFGPLRLARGRPRQELGPAEVVCINRRSGASAAAAPYDIAKVRVDARRARRLSALRLYRWTPMPGMRVRVVGYPGGLWTPVVAEGTITEHLEDQVFSFEVRRGLVAPGSSGSPVLAASGEVVGMVYAEGGGLLFATALNWVLDRTCR